MDTTNVFLKQQEITAFNTYVTVIHNTIVLTYCDELSEKELPKLERIKSLYLDKGLITFNEAMKLLTEL